MVFGQLSAHLQRGRIECIVTRMFHCTFCGTSNTLLIETMQGQAPREKLPFQ
jgi:hypothetical protein